jgi:hypothetical protein
MLACVCALMQEAAAAMLHETSTTGGSITGPAGSSSASLRSSLATSSVAGTCLADDAAALGASAQAHHPMPFIAVLCGNALLRSLEDLMCAYAPPQVLALWQRAR